MMNFTPFSGSFATGGQFPRTAGGGQVVGVLSNGEGGVHYLRPVEPGYQQQQIITLPISIKQGDSSGHQAVQIQVVNPGGSGQQKYHVSPLSLHHFPQGVLTVAYAPGNQEAVVINTPVSAGNMDASNNNQLLVVEDSEDKDKSPQPDGDKSGWQTLAPGATIADYLSRMPASTLPLNLHHFLKFSAETIKREAAIESSPLSSADFADDTTAATTPPEAGVVVEGTEGKQKRKKKYKKKAPKPKRPRPGQVHIATALDGTTLFCCPQCNMAYPDKELLEQHLVGHKIERRFICDLCGAGLKRKEHLERHKLGHNPDRPFACSVCGKGFKRKEHLNLHFVIHSGEKTEVCTECGKGFYRKDHLRKHARSHIAKRVKEELSTQTALNQQIEQQQLAVLQQEQQLLATTVVLPTAAETGAMMLQHQH